MVGEGEGGTLCEICRSRGGACMCKGAGTDRVGVVGGICDCCETIDAGDANGSSPVGDGRSVFNEAGGDASPDGAASVAEPWSALICEERTQNSFIYLGFFGLAKSV